MELLQNLQHYAKWDNISKNRIPFLPGGPAGDMKVDLVKPKPESTKMMNGPKYQPRQQQRNRQGRKNINNHVAEQESLGARLSHFKLTPTIHPTLNIRPSIRNCCHDCLPDSQKSLVDEVSKALGYRNLLYADTEDDENSYFVKKFCHVVYVWTRKSKHLYPRVGSTVLNDEHIHDALETAVLQEMEELGIESGSMGVHRTLLQKQQKRAARLLEGMRTKLSVPLLRLTSWLVFKVLGRVLNAVVIPKGQIEMIKRASASGLPLIYLPLHRSHVDYVLASFLLFNNNFRCPMIAAGDNLRIPVLGYLLKCLGAFFIKRKIDPQQGKKDVVYRNVLHTYVTECLRAGHHMEVFIEGGRCRSGKPAIPKGGMLSIVLDAYNNRVIEDALLIPLSINYDKILDGNFINEQLGVMKVMETFMGALRGVWQVFSSNYGNARMDIGQPFSLREYLTSYQQRGIPSHLSEGMKDFRHTLAGYNGKLRMTASSSSLFGTDVAIEEERHLVESLSRHVVYDAAHCTSIMTTDLVAFLLLNKFRDGVTLQKLALEMDLLREELQAKKRDLGFSGHSVDACKHAISLLGPGLVIQEKVPIKEGSGFEVTYIRPITMLPNIIELSYYSNAALNPFVLEAIVATSIHAILGEDFKNYRDSNVEFSLKRSNLVQKCFELCSILQFEFIFCPPCILIEQVITDTIEMYLTKGIFHQDQVEATKSNRQIGIYESDSEDEDRVWSGVDQDLKLSLNSDSIAYLNILQQALAPLLDTYYWCAFNLERLVQRERKEREFQLELLGNIKNRVEQGLVRYGESLALDSIRNSLKLFEYWRILEFYSRDGVRLYYLSKQYDSEEHLAEVILHIHQFQT